LGWAPTLGRIEQVLEKRMIVDDAGRIAISALPGIEPLFGAGAIAPPCR
jgi:hypothetical protein